MSVELTFGDALVPLVPLFVFVVWGLAAYARYRWKNRGRAEWPGEHGGSVLLSRPLRTWWCEEIDPIADWLIRKGIKPNHITVFGTCFSLLAAVMFAFGWFPWAGYVMLFGSVFDMLDGRVARGSGVATRSGAYLDSTLDRYADILVFIGLAVAFRESWFVVVVLFALAGSVMVSYARARAEGLGLSCRLGLMQRPERIVVVGFAAILDPLGTYAVQLFGGTDVPVLLPLAITAVAVLTQGTAVARIRTVFLTLKRAEQASEGSEAPATPPVKPAKKKAARKPGPMGV